MYEEIAESPQEMHGEEWWIRLMDDDLSADEREQWNRHLGGCSSCQREWAALLAADEALAMVPAAPALPETFTAATVARIVRRQRLQRLATLAAGVAITALVTLVVVGVLGAAYMALDRSVGAVLSARQIVFGSLVQTFVGLLLSWKALLPYIVGTTLVLYLALMPQGVLVTATLLWLTRRRRHAAARAAAAIPV
jgi:anti-sigma factor RsiW